MATGFKTAASGANTTDVNEYTPLREASRQGPNDLVSDNGARSLWIASRNGHVEAVTKLLKNGASVNMATNDGATSLMVASQNGHAVVVSELLKSGASVDLINNDGATSLYIASRNGHVEVVSELLKSGASVEYAKNDGWTSLMVASKNGHVEVVTKLLKNGASVDMTSNDGWTSLIVASQNGHVEVLIELLKNGASVDMADINSRTSLYIASRNGYVEVVSELLKSGASVEYAKNNGWTSLMVASLNGHVEVVSELLKNGASVDMAENNGWTSLHFATRNCHVEVVSELLKNGASLNMANNDGWTSLHIASENGHVEVVSELFKNDASVDMADNNGWTSLHIASENGHVGVVSELLKNDASVDMATNDGATSLHIASFDGHVEVLIELLKNGASVDMANNDGATSLMIASRKGHVEVLIELLKNGASVDMARNDGWTSLMIASENGHVGVLIELLKNGASAVVSNGLTPLQVAARSGHVKVVEMLFSSSVRMDISCVETNTALHLAAQEGHDMVLDVLLTKGVLPDTRDEEGNTPLISACRNGHWQAAQRLLKSNASLSAINKIGESALLAAASAGSIKFTAALIQAGASPHVRASNGDTILVIAAKRNMKDMVNQLLEAGYLIPLVTPESGVSLLEGTLQTLREYSENVYEFEALWQSVADRLTRLFEQLETEDDVHRDMLHLCVMVVFRFIRVKTLCETRSIYSRLVVTRNIVGRLRDLHTEMSFLQQKIKSAVTDEASQQWAVKWESDETDLMSAFQEAINADTSLSLGELGKSERVEAVTLLQHELKVHSDKYTPEMLQLLERALCQVSQKSASDVNDDGPDWFIPPHELDIVQVESKSSSRKHRANHATSAQWLNSMVKVSEFRVDQAKFINAVDQWVFLSHPNVVKLFGATHLQYPYTAAFESAAHTSLLDYLRLDGNRRFLWQKLHEVALGLKYLHDRGIILEYLNCEHVWVGTGGTAKINGFGIGMQEDYEGIEGVRWRSPEALRGGKTSVVSNVYSLAVFIYESVTGEAPWINEKDRRVAAMVKAGYRPEIPDMCGRPVIDLADRMWCADPTRRMNLATVIEHLKQLGELRLQPESVPAGPPVLTSHRVDIETYLFPEFGSTLPVALDKVESKCRMWPASQDSVLHINKRLRNVFDLLRQQHKTPNDFAVKKFCQVLRSLDRLVRTALSEKSVLQRAKSQVVGIQHDLFHRDIDEILDILSISTDNDPVHKWTEQLATRDRDVKNLESVINRLQKQSAVAQGAVKILRFDSETVNKRFQSVDRSALNVSEPQLWPWFIPTHQLKYDRGHSIGTGAFGDVYKATWLGTSVVIKFMGYEADGDAYNRELFYHELQVWFPLNHPHVIRLFGACHVGKRFFACEYAGNGTLDGFLRKGDNSTKKWRKLYQVALGLQYLHSLNIVHNDLKCDNVLIGANEDAKITDFGLSCIPNSAEVKIEAERMGAVQWKSPEYLRGERLTVASDLYAFGMCILEAVSGNYPWGSMIDAAVRFQVRNGNLPRAALECLDGSERALVEMICAPTPSERIKISSVVEKLDEFAKLEAVATKATTNLPFDVPAS
ncbi:Serine/threonine-protein phosphatase 6 regulatory ankyrin repeat subunit, partial [Globisporangium splendens]